MTEQIQDQISAFSDDELSAEECAFLVRRLERDPESRRKASRYSIIGAALRGEVLAPEPDVLRRRIQAELGGLPAAAAQTHDPTTVPSPFLRPALGFGIAATVAVVALLALGGLNRSAIVDDPSGLVARDASNANANAALSYVVPQEAAGDSLPANQPLDIRLTNYLLTHGTYAPGLTRTSIHSKVVGNQGSLVFGTEPPEQD